MSAQRDSPESPESSSVSVATSQTRPNVSEISTGDQTTSAGGSAKEAASGSQGGVAGAPLGVPVVVVNGERFRQFPVSVSTEEHLRNLKNMPMREDDVIVAAYAKSGTHWVWEVVHMLTSGKAEYESRAKEHLMLEFIDAERFVSMPSPRIINSHLSLRYLSKEIVTKRTRVIHVMRNPKDIAVSLYHHLIQMKKFKDRGFISSVQMFLNGGLLPGTHSDYFVYLPEMEKWQKEHPEVPALNLYFEDMKQDPVAAVKQIARFLGQEVSDSLCADIAEACSFNKLKKADETKDTPVRHLFKGDNPQLYRKGEVGDWKNYFTVALSERFDSVVADRLKDCVYAKQMRYTL